MIASASAALRAGDDPARLDAINILHRITDEEFLTEALPLHIDIVWRQRFYSVASAFLTWERARRPEVKRSLTEVRGNVLLRPVDITISGIADRIDIRGGGFADIIDYKTGLNPSANQARSLLDPQLALEAAALLQGAFKPAGDMKPLNLVYVRLRPGDRFSADQVNNEMATRGDSKKSALELATQSVDELGRFVQALLLGGDVVQRSLPGQRLDAAHTGGNTAFGHDLEYANVAGA